MHLFSSELFNWTRGWICFISFTECLIEDDGSAPTSCKDIVTVPIFYEVLYSGVIIIKAISGLILVLWKPWSRAKVFFPYLVSIIEPLDIGFTFVLISRPDLPIRTAVLSSAIIFVISLKKIIPLSIIGCWCVSPK